MHEKSLTFEEALEVANEAVFAKTGRYLTDVETVIFRGSWQSQTYEEMAAKTEYTVNYLQRTAGQKFWRLLSEALGEEVSKTNFRTALERGWRRRQSRLLTMAQSSATAPEIEFPEGPMALNSSFYLERLPIESDCYHAILQPGALIRIKAPKQMGKTSLLNRILARASEAGYQTVNLNLLLAERGILQNLSQFLQWFCKQISRKLRIPDKLAEYWDEEIYSSNTNCTEYFENYLLSEINTPIALGLDEVDRIFPYPEIAQEFFGLLRYWHESAKTQDSWKKLRLVIVHSTEVYIPLHIYQSPFNVGLPAELKEFTEIQLKELAGRYGLSEVLGETGLKDLMAMIGGHPYLVQLALYHLRRQDISLPELLQTAPTDIGIYRQHLQGHWGTFQEYPQLAEAFQQVIKAGVSIRLEQMLKFKLLSMGLVKQKEGGVIPSFELYRRYFLQKQTD